MNTQKRKWVVGTPTTSAASGERPALNFQPGRGGSETDELEQAGFSGTCERTSLADWIQLVQMGRRDAVVSIKTHDGKMGRLWCRGGDIIDASCDGQVGADAVYRALSWEGGKVSVDFRKFERARQIPMATAALLLEGAYRKDSGVRELGRAERRSSSVPSPSPEPPALGASSVMPSVAAKRKGRGVLAIGLLSASLLLGLAIWLATSTRSAPVAQPSAVLAARTEYLVRVDVEPAHAEISLDGKRAGAGQLSRSMTRDGVTHEILASAAGYVSERLLFRDTPLLQRLVLKQSADSQISERVGKPAPPRTPLPPRARAPSAPSRPALLQVKQALSEPRASTVIEESRPRIQVIDEHRPRIEVIE